MTKEQFTAHQSTHAPQDRDFGCAKCAMTFVTQILLERHIRDIHNRERSYKCKICEKAFFSKSDLQIHLAVHTGDRKYDCTECSRKFKHVSNFLRHMRTHTGCKPYICSICGQRFNQIATLRRHKKSKHQECQDEAKKEDPPKHETAVDKKSSKKTRKSHCGQCGETFSYHSEMIHHLESIHYVRNQPESANEMLNEIVQDFNKNAGTLGESVDALIKGIFNEDSTIDVDSIIVNNVSSLYSDKANLPTDFLISNSDSQEALEMPYFKIPDYPMNPDSDAGNIKLEVSVEYSQNLIESEFGVAGDSSICNELGVSMLQDIEQYLPPRTDSVDLELPSIDAECATIFESDVDLDQSSLLAENLNHLIEQNSVQFISADDSDTYIISLNSSMDAEKLSSFLNIENLEITTVDEPELLNQEAETTSAETAESALTPEIISAEIITPKIAEVQNSIQITDKKIDKKKPEQTTFVCKVCNKTLKNKYNFKAHLGTHYKKYRKFKCQVCTKKFSWQSTLNKHTKAEHALEQSPLIKCDLDHCSKHFKHNWQIAEHKRRDHNEEKMYRCLETGCSRSFFKKSDLRLHLRTHTRERPYSCHQCPRRFSHPSHLRRHERMPHNVQSPTALLCRDCGRAFHQPSALNNHKQHCCKQTPIITTPIADLSVNHLKPAKVFDSDFSTQLLSDIEDVLKFEMTVKRES